MRRNDGHGRSDIGKKRDVAWPVPFAGVREQMKPSEARVIGELAKAVRKSGDDIDQALVIALDVAKAKDELKIDSRITFLTGAIAGFQRVGRDCSIMAKRLAEVRLQRRIELAVGKDEKEKEDFLVNVTGWPVAYREHWDKRLRSSKMTHDDLLRSVIAKKKETTTKSRRTRLQAIRAAVSLYFDFCRRNELPVEVDLLSIDAWVDDLLRPDRDRPVSFGTVADYLCRLKDLVKLVEPLKDVSVLGYGVRAFRGQASNSAKSPKRPHHPGDLANKGIALMNEARRAMRKPGQYPSQCARDFRDGLIIVFMALFPLRRANVAPLQEGKNLFLGSDAKIDLSPDETKAANRIRFKIPQWMVSRIVEWKRDFMSCLTPLETPMLFATHLGAGLSMCQLSAIVKKRTGSTAHGFRHAAATMIVEESDRPGDGTDVLGQTSSKTRTLYSRTAETLHAADEMWYVTQAEIERLNT